jgi:hypothetical protein
MTHATDIATTRHPGRTGTNGTLRALQVTAVLAVLNLLCQFVTAGQLFGRGGPEGLHAAGAIVLHVVTGLLVVAAVLHARSSAAPRWPAVLAVVVFVLTFVQAWFGSRSTLAVHVPGAMILTVGTVWLAAWSLTRAARR